MIDKPYDYESLIEKFLNQEITIKEFEDTYTDKFLNEKVSLGGHLFDSLDWLFAQIDDCVDNSIYPLDEHDIDEDQLRESAAKVLKEIRALK